MFFQGRRSHVAFQRCLPSHFLVYNTVCSHRQNRLGIIRLFHFKGRGSWRIRIHLVFDILSLQCLGKSIRKTSIRKSSQMRINRSCHKMEQQNQRKKHCQYDTDNNRFLSGCILVPKCNYFIFHGDQLIHHNVSAPNYLNWHAAFSGTTICKRWLLRTLHFRNHHLHSQSRLSPS